MNLFPLEMPVDSFCMGRFLKNAEGGEVYVCTKGTPASEMTKEANFLTVYREEHGENVPVQQPILLNQVGLPVVDGEVVSILCPQEYAIAVYDAYGEQQFYFPNVLNDLGQLRSELASNNGSNLVNYSGRTLTDKLKDVVDIKDFGAIPGNAAACTSAIKAAIAYIKTQYRGAGTIYISNSRESNAPYLFNETILLDSQGLRIIGDSRWGSNIQTTAGVDPAIKVIGSSCEVSDIYLTTAEGVTGVHLKDGNNFSSNNLVIKIAEIGMLHEKGNCSWIRNFLAESCGTGYKMYPTLGSDCNGSYIHGRSYNCEIGFEMTGGSDGTKHPGMNTIYYSCEGNVIGFKETGGRYNYLNIYSESNRKVSSRGNTNANFSTVGRPNIWVAQNPDNDENVIKGAAVGFYSRGGQVYQKVSGYERNIVTQTIQTGSLGDPSVGIYEITNGTSTTHQLTLGFLPYLRPGQEVTIISRNTANGWQIRQTGGVVLYGAVVDGSLFGAYVASGKADILKVTKINDTMALTEFIRGE